VMNRSLSSWAIRLQKRPLWQHVEKGFTPIDPTVDILNSYSYTLNKLGYLRFHKPLPSLIFAVGTRHSLFGLIHIYIIYSIYTYRPTG
jgi:hypothetical protein